MNLAEVYALSAGQSLDKIWTYEKFFPIGIEGDYIVIQPFTKPAKNYSYWSDVIELLYPILEKNNIKIMQVGGKDEPALKGCYQTQGQTTWGQLEFLISKAKLVLTADSISSHLAGHYNLPLVVLISNNFKECVAPYYGDKAKQFILEPDRAKKNPSFALDEGPLKQIDEIKPETIVASVLGLLNIKYENKFETIYFGPFYTNKFVEAVPNQVLDIGQFGIDSFVMRMDFDFNENLLTEQLKRARCTIVTDKPINKDLLASYKPNIKEVVYRIDETTNTSFVELLQELNIIHHLVTSRIGENLNIIKLNFLEFGPINQKELIDVDLIKKIKSNGGKLFYKSGKMTLSSGKIYPSKTAWMKDQPIDSFQYEPVPIDDCDEFWKELECFKILLTKN